MLVHVAHMCIHVGCGGKGDFILSVRIFYITTMSCEYVLVPTHAHKLSHTHTHTPHTHIQTPTHQHIHTNTGVNSKELANRLAPLASSTPEEKKRSSPAVSLGRASSADSTPLRTKRNSNGEKVTAGLACTQSFDVVNGLCIECFDLCSINPLVAPACIIFP